MEPFSDLKAVQNPVARARGLANVHYTDLSVYEAEKHALLFRQWAGLGVAADIPQMGDAKPVDFLGVPLVMIRDRSNRVRVFQNICRLSSAPTFSYLFMGLLLFWSNLLHNILLLSPTFSWASFFFGQTSYFLLIIVLICRDL